MLKLSHVTKYYGNSCAAKDVSFEIKEGQVCALIGPNSSGKTTLVKTVVGIQESSDGKVTLFDKDIRLEPMEVKKHIGYIPDEPLAWGEMTGEEFILFSMALYGVPVTERKKRLSELLPLFNVEDAAKKTFDEYSRGFKQKFSILAALAHKPSLLVVDEPIVGLDPDGAEIAKKIFKEHAKNGGAVLLVTHTLSVVEDIADTVGVLTHGRLRAFGTIDELRKEIGNSDAHVSDIYSEVTGK